MCAAISCKLRIALKPGENRIIYMIMKTLQTFQKYVHKFLSIHSLDYAEHSQEHEHCTLLVRIREASTAVGNVSVLPATA